MRQIVSGWMKSARGDVAAPGRRRASTRSMADEQMTRSLVEGGTFGLAGTIYGQLAVRSARSRRRPTADGATSPPCRRRHRRRSRGMNPALGQLIAVLRAQADSLEQALELTERQTDAIVRRELDRINRAVAEPRAARSSRAASWRSAGSASPPSWPTRSAWSAGDSTLSTLAAALPAHRGERVAASGGDGDPLDREALAAARSRTASCSSTSSP